MTWTMWNVPANHPDRLWGIAESGTTKPTEFEFCGVAGHCHCEDERMTGSKLEWWPGFASYQLPPLKA
jgi:hypothetical protein